MCSCTLINIIELKTSITKVTVLSSADKICDDQRLSPDNYYFSLSVLFTVGLVVDNGSISRRVLQTLGCRLHTTGLVVTVYYRIQKRAIHNIKFENVKSKGVGELGILPWAFKLELIGWSKE